jgi:cytoskeletal protein CcmA (bactofilin family)
MRRSFFAILFFTLSFVFASPALANSPIEPARKSTFIAQDEVTLDGEYPGSVYVMGGEVVVTGVVSGDLVVLGGSVRVRGTVEQDIYVAGGTIILDGTVQGDLVAAGSEVRTLPGSNVGGNLLSASKRLVMDGNVYGDIHAKTKEFVQNGTVGGTSMVEVMKPREVAPKTWTQRMWLLINRFLFEVAWRGVVLAFIWFFGREGLKKGFKLLQAHPVKAFFDGVTVSVFTLTGAFLFLITLFGFPIFLAAVAALVGVTLTGWTFVVPWIGEKILPKQPFWMSLIAGLLVLSLIVSIPVVGWIVQVILLAWSVGVWWNLLSIARVKKHSALLT